MDARRTLHFGRLRALVVVAAAPSPRPRIERRAEPLVVDLARKKGIDEVAAFTLASKAAAGNAGALKRSGEAQ